MKNYFITLKNYENYCNKSEISNFEFVTKNSPVEIAHFVEEKHKEASKIVIIGDDACFLFMYLTKIPGLVVAPVSDEHSAFMTLSHNNTKVIIIPAELVGSQLALSIFKNYAGSSYEGARHAVRIDMLDKELE